MSLFKARDWWSTVSGFEEFHTNGLLVTTSLDPNKLQYEECVIVGSFSNILRAYRPRPGPYSPDHLLLERQLNAPITQLAIEHLVGDTITINLVVLHPRSVVVYSLALDNDQLSLVMKYRHNLSHISHSMVTGPLGRVTGHDLVCVQSMDGLLTVLDHGEMLFSCSLAGFFLPGPLVYSPRTDSIVTVGNCRKIDAYRYQSLTSSAGLKNKPVNPEWSVELGEEAVDIKTAVQEEGPSLILILGERNLYCFRDDSKRVFCKKLDHAFSVIHPYKLESVDDELIVQYLLAGHTQQLQVMRNETMIWAAQLPHVPVAMATSNFKELEGVIVTLDEIGHLQISYLGTDPTSYNRSTVMGVARTNQSLKEMTDELNELSQLVQDYEEDKGRVAEGGKLEMSMLGFGKPRPVEGEESEGEEAVERQCVECRVSLSNTSTLGHAVYDVLLNIDVATPLSVHPSSIKLPSIEASCSEVVVLTVVCSGDIPSSSLTASLTLSYANEERLVQNVDHTSSLPVELICRPCVPQDGQYKLTLGSSLPCVLLADLYPDNDEGRSPNAMAYRLLSGPVVTIITSKTSDRYRIQSDSFSSLAIFVCDLVTRLTDYHKDKNLELKLNVGSPIPLPDYFELIDQHYKVRVGLEQCKELLGRHAHQFRAIQKRLLSHFKDKTPSGLSHLDTLLDGTYMQLIMLAEKYDELRLQEEGLSRQLSSASLLLITFLKLNAKLSDDEVTLLQATFSPNVIFDSNQGWEEVVDTAVTQLLRSSLAKSVKDQSTNLPGMALPQDSLKIKRHIALLCDRILKGGHPTATRSLIETTPTSIGQLPPLTEESVEM